MRSKHSDLADSHIEFEVWLPTSGWNGKYEGVGNGGFAGYINYRDMAAALSAGYTTSSTDTGHRADNTDGRWALGHDSDRGAAFPARDNGVRQALPRRTKPPGSRQSPDLGRAG